MPHYHIAVNARDPEGPNPRRSDGVYPQNTTGLLVMEAGPAFIGRSRSGLFHYKFSKNTTGLEAIIADLIRYEQAQGRELILFLPGEWEGERVIERALAGTPPPHVVRETDPCYLVHSTTLVCAAEIRRDGAVRSLGGLRKLGREPVQKLRSAWLGEPSEYAEYVNLGPVDSPYVETVPGSHTSGRFISPDDPYEPGARFYIDAHRLIRAGMEVRIAEGIKVRDEIPLEPFCVAEVGVGDVELPQGTAAWTPRLFTELANRRFREILSGSALMPPDYLPANGRG